jgi:hypothetical protein
VFIVKDESGTCSVADPIILLPEIGSGTLIDNDVSYTMDTPGESRMVYCNGTHWFVI